MGDNNQNVRVAVRCRPFNNKERNANEVSCVKITKDTVTITNPAGTAEDYNFGFDLIYDVDCKQEDVWSNIGVPILEKALNGYNGTIFAYGQTGSGKTWSMTGGDGELRGIIPRMNVSLFDMIDIEKSKRSSLQFLVTLSYFELYNEAINDLLDPDNKKKKANAAKGGLEIKEHPSCNPFTYKLNLIKMILNQFYLLKQLYIHKLI
jgi:hypothetical protein